MSDVTRALEAAGAEFKLLEGLRQHAAEWRAVAMYYMREANSALALDAALSWGAWRLMIAHANTCLDRAAEIEALIATHDGTGQ